MTAVTAQHRAQEQAVSSYEVATMLREAVANWWLLQIRGIMAIAFGAFLLFLAGSMEGRFTAAIALVGVLLMFILYLIASGILSLVAAVRHLAGHRRLWAAAVHGSILVALGVWLFLSDEMTVMWLFWFTVANAFGTGMLELALAHRLHKHDDAILLRIAGVLSVALSLALIVARNARISTLVVALGIYAVFYGSVLVTLSLRLWTVSKHLRLHGHASHAG